MVTAGAPMLGATLSATVPPPRTEAASGACTVSLTTSAVPFACTCGTQRLGVQIETFVEVVRKFLTEPTALPLIALGKEERALEPLSSKEGKQRQPSLHRPPLARRRLR
jgi:hypothetical protein